MATNDPDLLTIPQAAEKIGVSVHTVRRRIEAGDLPAYRLGPRLVRVRLSDLEQFPHPVRQDDDVLEARIRSIVAAAPPLSPAQRSRLAGLFDGLHAGNGGDAG